MKSKNIKIQNKNTKHQIKVSKKFLKYGVFFLLINNINNDMDPTCINMNHELKFFIMTTHHVK